MKLPTMSARLV